MVTYLNKANCTILDNWMFGNFISVFELFVINAW